MNDNEVVGKSYKSFQNWHRIKLYSVAITDALNCTIWYANKKGKIFYAILSTKSTSDGWVAMFRVVEISEDATSIKDPVLLRYINPSDCVVVEEKQLRVIDRMERLLVGRK